MAATVEERKDMAVLEASLSCAVTSAVLIPPTPAPPPLQAARKEKQERYSMRKEKILVMQ